MTTLARARPLFDPPLVREAIKDSFIKLAPWVQWRNPVMFVVLVGSVLITGLWLSTARRRSELPRVGRASCSRSRCGCGPRCCSRISPRAWPKGAARHRPRRCARASATSSARRFPSGRTDQALRQRVASRDLRRGDVVLVEAGDTIPGDGEVIWGTASVDESAITGESAPVIREAGGDRSAVTGGTRLLSDTLHIRITANPGEAFLDRMIAMVENAKRQRTPNEIALAILLAGLTADLPQDHRDAAAVLHLQRGHGRPWRADLDHGAGGAAGVPDSDHHRRTAVGDRHRRHGSHDPGQRHRDLGPRGRGGRRCRRAAARQDRHHHARQSPGLAFHSRTRRRPGGSRRRGTAVVAGR